MATPVRLAAPPGTPAAKALQDVVNVTNGDNGRIALHQLIPKLSPLSKDVIFRSGKGLEGFLRSHADVVTLTTAEGLKYVSISNENGNGSDSSTAEQPAQRPLKVTLAQGARRQAAPRAEPVMSSTQMKMSTDAADLTDVVLPEQSNPTYRLIKRIHEIAPPKQGWYNMNEVYNLVYSTEDSKQGVRYADFQSFLRQQTQFFWTQKAHYRARRKDENAAPEFNTLLSISRKKTTSATHANNFGGWGSATGIPTGEDVYEILRYIPIEWTNLGNVSIPTETKKKHVRIASFLQWLRRQPKFFEVRNLAGTQEVRRAICLHPEAHGMTKEAAEALIEERIQAGIHNNLDPQANAPGIGSSASVAAGAVFKFVNRVCPSYFTHIDTLLARRATKRGMSAEDMWRCIESRPDVFEELQVTGKDGSTARLVRKRLGCESSKWCEAFVEDLKTADNLDLLVTIAAKTCPLWDRLQYLYVRLTDEEKIAVGGYDGMVTLLQSHPQVFRCGEYFCRRIDNSDLQSSEEEEPTSNEVMQGAKQVEENPYNAQRELAVVFHYLIPEDADTTASYLVEASSPAMRSVLPPRLVTLLQQFPDMFSLRETSPGFFSVERRKAGEDDRNVDMSPEECVEGVAALVPLRGVDLAQLQVWMSQQLKAAVTAHFGSLAEMLKGQAEKFHVVENPPYTTVYKQRAGASN